VHDRWTYTTSAARNAAQANPATSTEDLLGKPWQLQHEVISLSGLPYEVDKAWVEYEWDGESYEDPTMMYDRSQTAPDALSSSGAFAEKIDFPNGTITSHATDSCTEDMVEWLARISSHDVAVRVMVIPHVEEPEDKVQVKSGTRVSLLPPLPPPRQLKNEARKLQEEIEQLKQQYAQKEKKQTEKEKMQAQEHAKRVEELEAELEEARHKCQCSLQ
jgi:hypothetical protein